MEVSPDKVVFTAARRFSAIPRPWLSAAAVRLYCVHLQEDEHVSQKVLEIYSDLDIHSPRLQLRLKDM